MTFLRSVWRRIGGGPRETVELNPVEQLALLYLLEYGSRTADDIQNEVGAHRLLIEDELDEGLAHLLATGLVESTLRLTSGQSETFYNATKKARALRNRIPKDPHTVTEFYL
jgi:predicted ArsR family transcriptional regulator